MLDFHLKAVTFLGRPCSIVCQNENGPCPLLAIANVLLLQDRMNIHSDRGVISLPELTQLVANTILEGRDQLSVEGAAMVECVLNILPKLAQGLDLNVFFDSVSKFEFTEEISVFDSLNIPLFHGWLVDDADYPTAEVVKGMSYNHLLFKLVEYKSLCDKLQDSTRHQDSLSDEEKSLLDTGGYLEQFFNSTATQLTNKGVQELYKIITDRQLAVFFRNNHFSTIFSYEGQLFLLMTDQGFLTVPNVVWEILDGIDGNSELYDDVFHPSRSTSQLYQQSQGMQESAATPSKPREGTYARPLDSPMPSLPSGRSTETTFAVPEEKSHPNESDLTAANTAIVQKIDLKNENSKSDTVPESTSGHLGHSGAIDPDLALAMQLQMQEEESFVKAEERIPPVTHGHSTERKSDQTKDGSNSHHVGNKESFVDGLTQEERDQQFSMMIHHEEMQQARLLEQQQELERYGRQGKSKSGQTKSSNCVIS